MQEKQIIRIAMKDEMNRLDLDLMKDADKIWTQFRDANPSLSQSFIPGTKLSPLRGRMFKIDDYGNIGTDVSGNSAETRHQLM